MFLSVVIPCYNEAESLEQLFQELDVQFILLDQDCEVILVDDGSPDNTWQVAQTLATSYKWLRGVKLQYNSGKAAALQLGWNSAQGKYIITMDGDLQDNPKEIPELISMLESGFDLVSGWKKIRHDPWHKTLPSKLFNKVTSIVAGQRLHDFNCGLKAYRSAVCSSIDLYGDFHRFIPVMAKWKGFKITEKVVEHRARIHGVSKYGWTRLFSGFLDLLTLLFLHKYMAKPMHFFGVVGLILFGIGFGITAWFGIEWVITGALHVRPLMVLSGTALILGFQSFSVGLLGELIISGKNHSSLPRAEEF
jgi:glycosyltransferase involved in cell wall biosynthesis